MTKYDDIYELAADNYGLITASQAHEIGVSDKEMCRIAQSGRLTRLGYGVYRIKHYLPTENDIYATSVALVGEGAYLYGESVLAMLRLVPIKQTQIYVATQNRVRRKLSTMVEIVKRPVKDDTTFYEGIRCQRLSGAIIACTKTLPPDTLEQAVANARAKGLMNMRDERSVLDKISKA